MDCSRVNKAWWLIGCILLMTGCERCKDPVECTDCNPEATPYELTIPAFFPPMDIPADNPLTVEGIDLGRHLFWDVDLSLDQTISCGSCHLQENGFSDADAFSTGVGGAVGSRNTMALVNMGWAAPYFWDGRAALLEDQVLAPVPHPDEMALPWPDAVARLQSDEEYENKFLHAFGTETITKELVAKAVAQFLRTVISDNSRFDQWRRGEIELTAEEFSGYQIFSAEGGDPETTAGGQFGGDCFHCHNEAGLQFSDYLFRNNGLDSNFVKDAGLAGITGAALDSGLFKTPTLRNVALSAPYMHDGRFNSLTDVIEHYDGGGLPSTTVDPFMKYTTGGLELAPTQKEHLIAFLNALTDVSFTTNSAYSNPH